MILILAMIAKLVVAQIALLNALGQAQDGGMSTASAITHLIKIGSQNSCGYSKESQSFL